MATITNETRHARRNGKVHRKARHKVHGNGTSQGAGANATPVAAGEAQAAAPVETPVPAPAPIQDVPPPVTEQPVAPGASAAPAPVATGEETPPEPPRPPIVRHPQPEELFLYIGKADNFLKGLGAAEEPLASLLAANRITPERVAEAIAQLEASQAATDTRWQFMLAESTAVIAMQRGHNLAQIAYGTFRQVGRTVFSDREADRNVRATLWLDLPIPGQIMMFLDTGRKVLAMAKQEPHVTRLAAAGYDAERIDETLALFNALDMLYDARQAAHLAAKNATETRDATVADLRTTIRQLRLEVSAILRANPGVSAPVGF
ncbi:MAG: hypothetical protein KIT77_28650 [Caldilinea sp.]|nr:hypothetical protein [Caldilineaceae bacterium]MCB9122266.1 hypothetical protein [Caldilineaceae bacterium]MCW5845258.1 hypothetical protein [Caldilinea sp.]